MSCDVAKFQFCSAVCDEITIVTECVPCEQGWVAERVLWGGSGCLCNHPFPLGEVGHKNLNKHKGTPPCAGYKASQLGSFANKVYEADRLGSFGIKLDVNGKPMVPARSVGVLAEAFAALKLDGNSAGSFKKIESKVGPAGLAQRPPAAIALVPFSVVAMETGLSTSCGERNPLVAAWYDRVVENPEAFGFASGLQLATVIKKIADAADESRIKTEARFASVEAEVHSLREAKHSILLRMGEVERNGTEQLANVRAQLAEVIKRLEERRAIVENDVAVSVALGWSLTGADGKPLDLQALLSTMQTSLGELREQICDVRRDFEAEFVRVAAKFEALERRIPTTPAAVTAPTQLQSPPGFFVRKIENAATCAFNSTPGRAIKKMDDLASIKKLTELAASPLGACLIGIIGFLGTVLYSLFAGAPEESCLVVGEPKTLVCIKPGP